MEIKCLDCEQVLITREEIINNLLLKNEKDKIICTCELEYSLSLLKEIVLFDSYKWEKILKYKLFRRENDCLVVANFSDGEPTHPDVMDLHYKFMTIK